MGNVLGEMMRNVERLDVFYNELKRIHEQYFPDWRFGQLCSNIFGWIMKEKKIDIFFSEEDKMLEYIREYAELFQRKGKNEE